MTAQPLMQYYTDAATANLDAFAALADTVFNASEQLLTLNGNTVRSLSELASASTQPLLSADVNEQLNTQLGLQGQVSERISAYLRDVGDLWLQLGADVAEVNASRFTAHSRDMITAFDTLANSAPAGGADFVAAMQSTLDNANLAYENLIKLGRDVTEGGWSATPSALPQPATATTRSTNSKTARKAA